MRFSKVLCKLLSRIELSEDDTFPYSDNYFSEKARFPDFNNNYLDYIEFLNCMLKLYFKKKRTESFEEFLNGIYPPKEKITCSDNADD